MRLNCITIVLDGARLGAAGAECMAIPLMSPPARGKGRGYLGSGGVSVSFSIRSRLDKQFE